MATSSKTTDAAQYKQRLRPRLQAFYQEVGAPASEAQIEDALRRAWEEWRGDEDEMFEAMRGQYAAKLKSKQQRRGSTSAPSPTSPESSPKVQPSTIPSTMISKSSSENQTSEAHRTKLRQFYDGIGEKKTEDELNKALQLFSGREEEMFVKLREKYASKLAEKEKETNNNRTSPALANPHRRKLRQFYISVGENKSEEDLDRALEMYAGKEEEMFLALNQKYGSRLSSAARRASLSPQMAPPTMQRQSSLSKDNILPKSTEQIQWEKARQDTQSMLAEIDAALSSVDTLGKDCEQVMEENAAAIDECKQRRRDRRNQRRGIGGAATK